MEFVHLFANHKDTVHHEEKGLCFEKKHHHCAFLSLTLTSFINDYSIDFARFETYEFVTRHYPVNDVYTGHYTVSTSLRGPPAA